MLYRVVGRADGDLYYIREMRVIYVPYESHHSLEQIEGYHHNYLVVTTAKKRQHVVLQENTSGTYIPRGVWGLVHRSLRLLVVHY